MRFREAVNRSWPSPMAKSWRALAALPLVAGCSVDAITPEPAPENRPPVVTSAMPAQSLLVEARLSVDVSAHFTDPDGDSLIFTASSSDLSVATVVFESGRVLRLRGRGAGEAVVSVTASDPGGLEASATFGVVVSESPDRAILVALYQATDGQNWHRSDNWLTDAPLSEWYGVEMNVAGRVSAIQLGANSLSGPIPPELGQLSDLWNLRLDGNSLSGPIPWQLGNLASLQFALSLSRNNLTGPIPPELGSLLKLERLHLAHNTLAGPIPPELGNLASLAELRLDKNELTSIPPALDNLASLEWLDIRENALTGPVPPELGNLERLKVLALSFNGLSGAIPAALGNLTNLEDLDLRNNALSGSIPPELGSLSSLKWLALGWNDLSGPIPAELGDLASLRWMNLYNNGLTGAIPPQLGQLARLEHLDLSGNELASIPSELENLVSLKKLSLSYNTLSGPIPAELGNLTSLLGLALDHNSLTGPIPPELGQSTSLVHLNLSHNALSGSIPPELGNLASLVAANRPGGCLQSAPGVTICLSRNLSLDNNDLTGVIPPELGNLASLEQLYLRANGLTGAIAPELGNLASLTTLLLDENLLSGPIPVSFAEMTSLTELWLDRQHCVPPDPKLEAWLESKSFGGLRCVDPDIRLLPRALLREDSNGLSLALPDDLRDLVAVSVSDPSVVDASVVDGWLVLTPRGRGETAIELVPSGNGMVASARVVVREAIGTFGIDIVMEQPIGIGYANALTTAADWWSSVLDGTELPDRDPADYGCGLGSLDGVVDDLVIWARSDFQSSFRGTLIYTCRRRHDPEEEKSTHYPIASGITVTTAGHHGSVLVMKHEIGHALGLADHFPPATGLMTEDGKYFLGPKAVATYRAGGGDPNLPGVPFAERCRCHWDLGGELMAQFGIREANAISLAALADAGYTVDISKAIAWPETSVNSAGTVSAVEPINDRVLKADSTWRAGGLFPYRR